MSTTNFFNTPALRFGSNSATHHVTAILNLGCPDSRQWYVANRQVLFQAVKAEKVELELRFWNKPVADLANGNIANQFVNYEQPETALAYIDAVYAQQKELNTATDVVEFLTKTFKIQPTVTAETIQKITQEVITANITSLPTIIIDDHTYFDDQLAPIEQLIA